MIRVKHFWPHALLLGFSVFLIFGILDNGQDWGGDFASYIMQAQSLVEGSPSDFVQANRFTIEHTTHTLGPVAYPWGYPAMLAPIYAAFGQEMLALKSIGAGCFVLLLIFLVRGFVQEHPGVWLLCLLGLFALNPILLSFLNKVNSDIPFMFVSMLCVLMIGRLVVHRRCFFSPAWDGVVLGLMIAAACTIRTNGVLLLATLFFTQIVSHRRAGLNSHDQKTHRSSMWVQALPYAAFFVVMFVWRAYLPTGGSSHLEYLLQVTPGSIKYHLTYYGLLPKYFYTGAPYPLTIHLLSLPLAILGLARRYRRDYCIVIYILLTYLIYVIWPPVQGIRFIFPILPFYLSFVLSGLEVLQGNAGNSHYRLRRILCVVPVLFVIVCFSVQSIGYARDNMSRGRDTVVGPYTESSSELFAFIKASTDPDATIMFYKPRVMRMLTGRKAYSTHDIDSLELADYLVISEEKRERQFPAKRIEQLAVMHQLYEVFANTGFRVYRIVPTSDHSLESTD